MMKYEEIKTVCRNNCGFLNRHDGEASQKKVESFDLLSLWVWIIYNNLNCNSGRDEGAGGPVEVFSEGEKVALCLYKAFHSWVIVQWIDDHMSEGELKVCDNIRVYLVNDLKGLLKSKETKISRQYIDANKAPQENPKSQFMYTLPNTPQSFLDQIKISITAADLVNFGCTEESIKQAGFELMPASPIRGMTSNNERVAFALARLKEGCSIQGLCIKYGFSKEFVARFRVRRSIRSAPGFVELYWTEQPTDYIPLPVEGVQRRGFKKVDILSQLGYGIFSAEVASRRRKCAASHVEGVQIQAGNK